MKTRSEYGARLQRARKHAKLTQKQLAALARMSQSNLSELETVGHGSAMTTQLAAVCGVDAHWLATGEGEMTSAASPGSASSTWPLERLRESTWRSLTERQKALLEDVMMAKLRELQAEEAQVDPVGLRRKQRSSGTQ